jgi:hypothetical protein
MSYGGQNDKEVGGDQATNHDRHYRGKDVNEQQHLHRLILTLLTAPPFSALFHVKCRFVTEKSI